MNDARSQILKRRARFAQAALTGALLASEACTSRVCLSTAPPCYGNVKVTPFVAEICAGQGLALSATGTLPNGTTESAIGVEWTSSNKSVAEVDATGYVTALTPGVANIVVRETCGGTVSTVHASVTVRACTDAGLDASSD